MHRNLLNSYYPPPDNIFCSNLRSSVKLLESETESEVILELQHCKNEEWSHRIYV